jgi:Tol biopolymer transport system component
MARTCPSCGRGNDDDASFCPACGATLSAEAAASDGESAHVGTTSPTASPLAEAPRRGKPARGGLVAAILVAVIGLVGVLGFAFIPRGDATDGQAAATPSAGATVGVSSAAAMGQYLAGAAGPRADRLAGIASDGAISPITRFSGERIRQIAYSPDGRWLACTAGAGECSDLWLFDAVTGAATQATAHTPDIVTVDSIAWIAGDRLLVAAGTGEHEAAGRNADLLVYGAASGSFTPLTDGRGTALRGVSVSASRGGARIAFVSFADVKTDESGSVTGEERLELLDRASGRVTRLGRSRARFGVDPRAFDQPLISPDGTAVIYRRAGRDAGNSCTVVAADGRTLMPARKTQVPAGYAWDPAGTRVVFTGRSPKPAGGASSVGSAVFWVFDVASGSTAVLAKYEGATVRDLSWSPDGASIAWAGYDRRRRGTGTIYLLRASGGDSIPLIEEALSPVWAPNAARALQTSPSP